jgi:homoserine dehydrogenase
MPNQRLAFIGFGNVARALAHLLERKRAVLKEQYDITFTVTGIATGRHGCAVDPGGLDIGQALRRLQAGESIAPLSIFEVRDALAVIQHSGADVAFENSPVNYESGQPAVDHCRAALQIGMHAITANKGTVVHGYRELSALAKAKGRRFFFEATVLGGTPVYSVFRACLPAAKLHAFKGIINSTTNVILTHMEAGESFDEAVRYCQSIGIAETDPSHDVDGWDAAIKVAALATVLMGTDCKPQQVERTGIREITSDMIRKAAAEGRRWKLMASAEQTGEAVKMRVAPELLEASSRFYGMQEASSGLEFRTDVLGDLAIIESDRPGLVPGPEPTAYALLADFINAVHPT